MAGRSQVSMQFPILTALITALTLNLTQLTLCFAAKTSPCRYQFTNGSVVDLEPTLDTVVTDDRFLIESTTFALYYNPCRNLQVTSAHTECKNVAGCYSYNRTNTSSFIDLGDVKNSKFAKNDLPEKLYLVYESNDKKNRVTVELNCVDGSGEAKLSLDSATNKSDMALTFSSKCCCPDKCLQKTPPSSSLSTGSILVIIVAVVAIVYFIGGIAFMHFLRGANGLEMIPHYEFWIDLPILIKDGIVFVLNGCKPEASYDRI